MTQQQGRLTATDFERLGLYDPDAPDAADRLALIEFLVGLGATEEELIEAERTQLGAGLALELILRTGSHSTFEDAATSAGLSFEQAARWWRGMGFPNPTATTPIPDELRVVLQLVGRGATDMLGPDTALALSRVLGATTYRVAEAIVDAFRVRYEGPSLRTGTTYSEVVKTYAELTRSLLPAFTEAMNAIFRQHLIDIASGTWSFDEEGSTSSRDLAVGFVDMVGYSSLSRTVTSGGLADLVVRFEDLVTEITGRHNGHVVKLIGDGAMFVSPNVSTACDIALEMVERFSDDEFLPPVHVGISAGPLIALQGDYFGDAANVAARLHAIAPASTVLVDETVVQRCGDTRSFEARPDLSATDIEISAHELLSGQVRTS